MNTAVSMSASVRNSPVCSSARLASSRVYRPGWQGCVAVLQNTADRSRHDPESGQPVLRIARLDLLFDDADPGDTRGFGRNLDRLFDAIGEVVELAVRVFRTGMTLAVRRRAMPPEATTIGSHTSGWMSARCGSSSQTR